MKEKVHVGDVVVHRGAPPRNNPYVGHALMGDERVKALRAFRDGRLAVIEAYTFWYAPFAGGARSIQPNQVDWETSGM